MSELVDGIEALIDAHGLYAVTEALIEVCHGKAEHLASNWQDPTSARNWTKAASAFDKTSAKLRTIQGV